MLGLLWIALLVGGYFAYQSAPRRAPFIVRVRGQAGYEVWIFNVRDMSAELRENAYTRNARVRYDLRRETAAHWEMRLDPVAPPPRTILFPTSGLSPTAMTAEQLEEQPWVRCGPPIDDQLESAYRSYNRLED